MPPQRSTCRAARAIPVLTCSCKHTTPLHSITQVWWSDLVPRQSTVQPQNLLGWFARLVSANKYCNIISIHMLKSRYWLWNQYKFSGSHFTLCQWSATPMDKGVLIIEVALIGVVTASSFCVSHQFETCHWGILLYSLCLVTNWSHCLTRVKLELCLPHDVVHNYCEFLDSW